MKRGISPERLVARANNVLSNPNQGVISHVVQSMTEDEMLHRILGNNYEKLSQTSEDLKLQLYVTMPAARAIIKPDEFSADYRVMLACLSPPFKGRAGLRFGRQDHFKGDAEWILEHMGKLALDRDDITVNHIRFILQRQDKMINRIAYKFINHELLRDMGSTIWFLLLRDIPNSGKYLDITKLRNKSELRQLILAHPVRVFKHVTLEQMKNSVIDAPTWIRIITQIPVGKRMFIPTGVIDWATKEVFRHKLKGRDFKKFTSWQDGIGTRLTSTNDGA